MVVAVQAFESKTDFAMMKKFGDLMAILSIQESNAV
jgi:hypothetical protein